MSRNRGCLKRGTLFMFLDMFARFRKDRLNGCIEDLLVQLVERFSKHSDLFREFIC